jgi:hypothetical protein
VDEGEVQLDEEKRQRHGNKEVDVGIDTKGSVTALTNDRKKKRKTEDEEPLDDSHSTVENGPKKSKKSRAHGIFIMHFHRNRTKLKHICRYSAGLGRSSKEEQEMQDRKHRPP